MKIEDIEYRKICLEKIARSCFKDNMGGIELVHYLNTIGCKLSNDDYDVIKIVAQERIANL